MKISQIMRKAVITDNTVSVQQAAKIIYKSKIPTYIVGSLSDMKRIIEGKSYKGSLIAG